MGKHSKLFSLKDTMQPKYDELLTENKLLQVSLGSAPEAIRARKPADNLQGMTNQSASAIQTDTVPRL